MEGLFVFAVIYNRWQELIGEGSLGASVFFFCFFFFNYHVFVVWRSAFL